MTHLIDKDALVAEIDRQKIGYNTDGKHSVEYNTTRKILNIIDTLEVKEVPEWKRATEDKLIGCLVWDEQRHFRLYNDRVFKGELYISMGDILELPNSPIKNKYDRQREEEHYQ